MKKIILIIVSLLVIMVKGSIYGATATITASKTEAYVGETVNINVKVEAAAWNLNVTGSNVSGGNITGFNMEGINEVVTKTYSLNTNAAGTYTIFLKGDISDGNTDITTDISKSIVVTVKTKPVTTSPTTPTAPSTNTTTPTTPQANPPTTNKNNNNNVATTLSSNAYLSQFRVDQPGISPAFSKTTYNYSITVGNDINNLTVTAVPEHSKATVTISGNMNLKEGNNTIDVKVTAQDKKTVKTYKIIVTKTDDPIKSNAFLQSLFVEDLKLVPEFSSEVFEYDLGKVNSDTKKINITAFPTNKNAKVDIIGNNNLVMGENTVKIIVTSENQKNQTTYTLKAVKEKEIDDGILGTTNDSNNNQKVKIEESSNFKDVLITMGNILKEKMAILLLYAFVWVEFIQVVYLYEKLRKLENSKVITGNIKEEIEVNKEKKARKIRVREKEN